MNYLTNYYKNLSEQLQERINLLEAEIYGPERKYSEGRKIISRDGPSFDPITQALNRKEDLEKLRSILQDKSHPIHRNPKDLEAIERVVADIEKPLSKKPGDRFADRLTRHMRGEEGQLIKDHLPLGFANASASFGSALAPEMRTAIDVLRGRYPRQAHDTNPTDEVPVYGNSQQ